MKRDYAKAIQLLTKAQDLEHLSQVPELSTISLVRRLLHFSRIDDVSGRFLAINLMA